MEAATKTIESSPRLLFGEWLVNKNYLTHRKLCEALSEQHQNGGRLGEVLCKLKMLNEEFVTRSLAEYLGLEYVRLHNPAEIEMDIAKSIPEKIAKRFRLVALNQEGERVVVAMADPLNIIAIDTVEFRIKRKVKVVVSPARNINDAIDVVYHGSEVAEQKFRDLVELELSTEEDDIYDDSALAADIRSEEEAASKAPVIRFVDLLLGQAVKRKASDVHLEPQEKTMIVRMRIDGILRETIPPPRKMQAAVLSRVKLLSAMNIAERRLPQDGRFKIRAPGRDIDVRVSALPTIYGEKVVMRILDKKAVSHDLDLLGFDPEFLREFKRVLRQPYGIVVVTGPTGSGKTTTLYSALNCLKDPTKNINTVEDPVEYRLAGINQVQVRPEIDLGFASCLRTILRQDPDIILIGEIRDKDTVEIAIQASLTGHLVLSTFHTNDAAGAISRLVFMGIEPFLLVSSLSLVVAQRLVRRICDNCKEPVTLAEEQLQQLYIDPDQVEQCTFYHGQGCKACDGTGYLGRLPIFELLIMDDAMRQLIASGASESEVRALGREAGGGNLLQSGVKKIMQGVTTAEEVLEATFSGDSRKYA
ncbi:MAG: GspE/PulE family protein [Planctomycetota bacterium]|jgi:type IV pilus assembly protein PilB